MCIHQCDNEPTGQLELGVDAHDEHACYFLYVLVYMQEGCVAVP